MSVQLNTRNFLLPFISCLLSLLVSCQSGLDEASSQEGECTVTFSVSNYKQVSFDDISSSGMTRATSTSSPSSLDHLLVAVFDAETGQMACSPIRHDFENYKAKPETYGLFSVTLPYGRYQLVVLGYSGSHECNISSFNHISWADDYVPNTFLYYGEYILNERTNLTKDIVLKHVVAAFKLTAEDTTPLDLQKMRFISSAGGIVLDATTGYASQNVGRTSEIIIPDNIAKEGVYFTIYLFLPEEQITSNYTVQAFGQNDALINEKHFNDVPLRINYLTTWQGKLFEKSDDDVPSVQPGFNVKWDMDWADTIRLTP